MEKFKQFLCAFNDVRNSYKEFRNDKTNEVGFFIFGYLLFLYSLFSFVHKVDELALDWGVTEIAVESVPITMANGSTGSLDFEYTKVNNYFLYFGMVIGTVVLSLLIVASIIYWDDIAAVILMGVYKLATLVNKRFAIESKPSDLLEGTPV